MVAVFCLHVLEGVKQAMVRLKAVGAPPTPILHSEWLDKACGCKALFKAEHLQRTGSFKYRGATNAVGALSDAEAAKGVVCHSSGNHGAAVAASGAAGVTESIELSRDCMYELMVFATVCHWHA